MTFFEVFIWYCKNHGIFGDIMRRYYAIRPFKWQFSVSKMSNFVKVPMSPTEWVTDGLYTISSMFEKFDCLRLHDSKEFTDAARKWRYFWKHNIKCDLSRLEDEDGKAIAYVDFWSDDGSRTKVTVEGVDIENMMGKVKYHNGGERSSKVMLDLLRNADGTPIEVSFYIKWRGKEYGRKN